MLVFKFGGASVKDAPSVKNLAKIVDQFNYQIVIIVSAMGKMTNALEQVSIDYFEKSERVWSSWQIVKDYHQVILNELFPDKSHSIYTETNRIFSFLENKLRSLPGLNFDFEYDQIVSTGELISTLIVAAYLNECGIKTQWKDIRVSLKSDENFREGNINWELSEELVRKDFVFGENSVLLTQGFLASTINNHTTTLGREGSDYTAAILGYILEAEKIVIWKDVPGILNADPKYFPDAILLPEISFRDAIELAYYGAKVIHPKTIQPLKKRNISLHVKSFLNPDAPGTVIGDVSYEKLIPSFIFKEDQVLLDFYPEDFSFVSEHNLEIIIGCFARHGLKINMMQNSAISFRVCVDWDEGRIHRIVKDLDRYFTIHKGAGLELVTIRYYDQETIDRLTGGRECLLEQRNGITIQMVLRKGGEFL